MVGKRSPKSGQSRWFIGYKKHSLRLWISRQTESVLLVPLVSWITPAHRADGPFLEPALRYCRSALAFLPDYVVADMAYVNLKLQRHLREQWQVGVITYLPSHHKTPPGATLALDFQCPQGQPLQWLGFQQAEQLHWFGVRDSAPLCNWCWEQSDCPREFAVGASEHEIIVGTLPLQSAVAQRLLSQVRKWIEATQSFEKNQLGLATMFLNSLRLAWIVGLLADTVCLLRAHAFLKSPPQKPLLQELLPSQLELELP